MKDRIYLSIIGILALIIYLSNYKCNPSNGNACNDTSRIDTVIDTLRDTAFIKPEKQKPIVKWKDSIVYRDTGSAIIDYGTYVVVPKIFMDSLMKRFFSRNTYTSTLTGNGWQAVKRDTVEQNLLLGSSLEVNVESKTIVKTTTLRKPALFVGSQFTLGNDFYFGPKVTFLNKSNTALYSYSYQRNKKLDLHTFGVSLNLFPNNKK